jgi:phosphoribosylaminoimidazole-succinocarboxamide synthase
MINREILRQTLPQVLKGVDLEGYGDKLQGKVRDFYAVNGKRITVTTDRQSAFDHILGHVPYKGAVLNLLSQFWFEYTAAIIPNHVITVPHPNVLISHSCEAIPVEMIVRGYMSGVTKTSIWHSYSQGERTIYGIAFPDGLVKNDQLPQPIITPTTHGGGANGHDERLTRTQIIERGIVSEPLYQQMEAASLALFEAGSRRAREQGLILVDTKYEFGLHEGKLMLIDEVHTPDSSRFWKADTYEQQVRAGKEPENFDKEFLRLWYADRGYTGDGTPPPLSEELALDLAERYIAVYERLTGKEFPHLNYPLEKEIAAAVQASVPADSPH